MNFKNFYQNTTLITATYNSEKVIKNFLSQKILSKFKKILIIDNASRDKTIQLIENLNLNNVYIIKNKINHGYPYATNIGYKLTKTKYAMLINPDTIFSKTFSIDLIRGLKRNPDFTIICPSFFSEYEVNNFNGKAFSNSQVKNLKKEDYISQMPGPCFILNKPKFGEDKFWDDSYFFYFDDKDLILRLRNRKIAMYSLYDLIIVNLDNKINENKHILKFKSWHYGWSYQYFLNKHYPNQKFIELLYVIKRIITYTLFLNFKKLVRQYYILRGMIAFYRGINSHNIRDLGPY